MIPSAIGFIFDLCLFFDFHVHEIPIVGPNGAFTSGLLITIHLSEKLGGSSIFWPFIFPNADKARKPQTQTSCGRYFTQRSQGNGAECDA